MGRSKKDPFADLDQDFKDEINAASKEQIRDKIAQISLNDAALEEAKELDLDLAQKKEAAKEAGAVYREGKKMNKLRRKYARIMLGEKGGDNGSVEE